MAKIMLLDFDESDYRPLSDKKYDVELKETNWRLVLPVRKELFWDRAERTVTPDMEIERAINFGGLDYIEIVRKKYGGKRFLKVLLGNRNLSKKAVNYWCLVLGVDREKTASFNNRALPWSPFR